MREIRGGKGITRAPPGAVDNRREGGQLFDFFQHAREVRRFNALPANRRVIVFYSEGWGHWAHLEPVIRPLLDDHNRTVSYLTSSRNDPGLVFGHPKFDAFLIGEGSARTMLFRTIEAGVMVTSTSDLDTFYLKRSLNPVHYVFIQHSFNSSHMSYQPGAWDHFDTIFCVGPHHVKETRARERLYDLPRKEAFEHGYGRLDAILARARERMPPARQPDEPLRLLVAPSWGANSLLNSHGETLIEVLLRSGYLLTVRPHPETRRLTPNVLDRIVRRFGNMANFSYEEDISSQDSLHEADLMVSDWSGAAHEFAFGLERPVLYVDVPRKVHNPDYRKLGIEPFEVTIREQIGGVLPVDRIPDAARYVERLAADSAAVAERIRAARDRCVFNLGKSGIEGARRIAELADEVSASRA